MSPRSAKLVLVPASGLGPLLSRAAQALGETHPELAAELTEAARLESTPTKGLSVARFLSLVLPILPILSLPPKEMRNRVWGAKAGALLKRSGLTEELAVELARKVAAWNGGAGPTGPLSVETLIARASQYLSAPTPGAEGSQPKHPRGPKPMWGEEDTSDE